jgi:hypothetical protein
LFEDAVMAGQFGWICLPYCCGWIRETNLGKEINASKQSDVMHLQKR